ncbi:MAG: amidohydrolase [Candidatus Rokubacteria bacterium]|nr:amidohydrolase [Candidatus Rokubacteria bacterium]
MKVIDADAHVEECTETWSFLEKQFYPRRPLPIEIDKDTVFGRINAFWLIDGEAFPKFSGRGLHILGTPPISEFAKAKPVSVGAQTLTDIKTRLADMDRLGIDIQVVFPTLFLVALAEDVVLEAALCRSYNSWMAEVTGKSDGRIKFSAVLPFRDISESVREMRRAKEMGAVDVMTMGLVWDKELGNKEFFPIYDEACRLDLPVCIHFGWGAPGLTRIFQTVPSSSFSAAMLPVAMGFYSIISGGVMDEFPNVRVAFLEAGSEWLPYALHQLERAWGRERARCKRNPGDYLKDGNIYISVEADEDINHLLHFIGEDQLVIASDYPHTDPSHEEDMVRELQKRTDLPGGIQEKILCHNPARLYSLE